MPNFPNKIWDGLSSDRKNHTIRRSPSIPDWEQIVLELQATQTQLSAIMQKLDIPPVPNMTLDQILAQTDVKYLSINSPLVKAPIERVPNTFIFIDENGMLQNLTYSQMVAWIRTNLDVIYALKQELITFDQIKQQTNSLYMSINAHIPVLNEFLTAADLRYKQIADTTGQLSLQSIITECDKHYLPKSTTILTLSTILIETDRRYAPVNFTIPLEITTGMELTFAGTSVPNGYIEANGQAINRTQYSALFALIGTAYGTGDNKTTFNVPNNKNAAKKELALIKV